MRILFLVGLSVMPFASCATHKNEAHGGGYSAGKPAVTLKSVTQVKESPARGGGYPISQFPLPVYPPDFALAGVTGEVTVRLIVGKDGHVTDANIIKSSFKEFEAPVLAAMKSWRFREMPDFPAADPKGLIVDCVLEFSLE